jgi:hypothetical protein
MKANNLAASNSKGSLDKYRVTKVSKGGKQSKITGQNHVGETSEGELSFPTADLGLASGNFKT